MQSKFQSTLSQGERHALMSTRVHGFNISIHALARRATINTNNPDNNTLISIHALARRATHAHLFRKISATDFNPRSRKESDAYWKIYNDWFREFQSTLSQGERHSVLSTPFARGGISIHALARRATMMVTCKGVFAIISIHALARRATLLARLQ